MSAMTSSLLSEESLLSKEHVLHSSGSHDSDYRWSSTCQDFLLAVPDSLRETVDRTLRGLHNGGFGLRTWISNIAWRGGRLPEMVPEALVQVYLSDPEAIPLHDCETCGIAIPVRPNRLHGLEGEPEQVYFAACPACGGRTGWFLYWARQAESSLSGSNRGPGKPR
jgi:hypothetical protein